MTNEWTLNFMHPRYGTMFPTTIDGNFTVAEMLGNLEQCGFLQPHTEGYSLANGNDLLELDRTFDEIPDIYDGCILRVVQNEAGQVLAPVTDDTLSLYFLHPHKGWTTHANIASEWTAMQLLQSLHERGFFQGDLAHFALAHKGQILDTAKTFKELNIESADFVEIIDVEKQKIESTEHLLRKMAAEIPNQHQGIFQQLQVIQAGLPRPSSLPIDSVLAINPTQVIYESFDSLVQRIRQTDNLPPPAKIRAKSIVPWLLVLLLMVLATLAGIFWHRLVG